MKLAFWNRKFWNGKLQNRNFFAGIFCDRNSPKRVLRNAVFAGMFAVLWLCMGLQIQAEELPGTYTKQTGTNLSKLADDSNKTGYSFNAGDEITVTAAEGEAISGLYIQWDSPVKEWTLKTAEGEILCGQNGFLHEYVALESPQTEVTISLAGWVSICEISIFDEGELPEWVQIWQLPCEQADVMIIPSHADDEILFFGGIIPTYLAQDAAIQVVYMTEFWTTAKVREHEKLDGLWASGLDIYPVCGDFKDLYSKTLEKAKTQYDAQAMTDYLTEQIRRFRPQVVVTHDINGEYGHGYHMLTFECTAAAVEAAASEEKHETSLAQYGTWDVPKTYIHLYKENAIELDLRVPLERFGGRTALEIATEAYKQHVSQQWCWFYVSDDYEYSCDEFGLYRTTVGVDTGNSMLENIVTYREQARLEEERIAAEKAAAEEAERLAAEEAARLEAEAKRMAEEKAAAEEAARLEAERAEAERAAKEAAELKAQKQQKVLVFLLGMGIVLTLIIVLFNLRLKRARKRKNGQK